MGSGWPAVLAPSAAAPTAELSRNFTNEKRFTWTAVLLGEHFMPAKNPVKLRRRIAVRLKRLALCSYFVCYMLNV